MGISLRGGSHAAHMLAAVRCFSQHRSGTCSRHHGGAEWR
ncbi:DUF3761 domain-containing protein [Paraburkholderia denitrificans]|uniref:DUF3761 domain-containing protein n=1 Tax=Paraburkholderia denitrificans TaxID=694025 RepID=A0ABW0J986_9BURK